MPSLGWQSDPQLQVRSLGMEEDPPFSFGVLSDTPFFFGNTEDP